ncbi:MAG: hypothetical protein IJA63_07240 [Akkermansia sp.]|nr:hypothetical protein [Akkermansia sp.]MBQ7023132.1 hypothetical protein [Akkermansia sp.]
MANTITDLKDVRISQNALLPWMETLLPLSAFSTNFSPDAADKLDTVKVPVIGAPSASSDYAGDYTANADSEASSVAVTLDRHKYKTVHLTAKEAATTSIPLLEKLVMTAAQQLAIDVMSDIFTSITAANFGTPAIPAIAAEDFGYKTIIKIREACAAAKMPQDSRALVLDNSYFSSLLADDIVAKSFISPLAQQGVVEAKVNRIAGFNVYETGCVPDNGENLVGFAAHPSSLAIAMRYLTPIANYDEAGAVTDPVTGLTFGYLRYTDTKSNKVYITLEALYGFKVVRPAGLQRIVSA